MPVQKQKKFVEAVIASHKDRIMAVKWAADRRKRALRSMRGDREVIKADIREYTRLLKVHKKAIAEILALPDDDAVIRWSHEQQNKPSRAATNKF